MSSRDVFKNTPRGIKINVLLTAEKFQMFNLNFSKFGASNFFSFVSYIWESLWDHSFSTFAYQAYQGGKILVFRKIL